MLDRERSEHLLAANEHGNAQLTDPHVLLTAMQQLRQEVAQEGDELYRQWRPSIQRRSFLLSGHNLAAYLALRQRDLRPLQAALMPWGLSSLGRGESRVLANLDAVIATLASIVQEDKAHLPKHPPLRTFFQGERLLNDDAEALFGRSSSPRRRIGVEVVMHAQVDTGRAALSELADQCIVTKWLPMYGSFSPSSSATVLCRILSIPFTLYHLS